MGRKGKATSDEVRRFIIDSYRARFTTSSIARMLGMKRSTVATIISSYNCHDKRERVKPTGRRRLLDRRALRRLKYLMMTKRFDTMASIHALFQQRYGYKLSYRSFQRYCRRIGAKRGPNSKKETLHGQHRATRIAWVKQRKFWTLRQWSNVIFSDESMIKIGYDRRVYVWKLKDEGTYRPDLYGDNKVPKLSLMMWGCMSWFGLNQ